MTDHDRGVFGTGWPAVGDEDTVWRLWPMLWDLGGEVVAPDGKHIGFADQGGMNEATNPMAMNVLYLSRIAPTLRATGLCHSVYWTMHDLSQLIGVPFEEVSYLAAGVNHQAWVRASTTRPGCCVSSGRGRACTAPRRHDREGPHRLMENLPADSVVEVP